MRLALAMILSLAAAALHAGDVYRWKDSAGKLNYSDAPPPGVDAVKIGPAGDGSLPAASAEQRRILAEKEAAWRKRQSDKATAAEKTAKEKAQAEQRAKACEAARSQLAALESGQRMVRYTSSGERAFLDDQERESEARDARRAIRDYCK